MMSKKQWVVLLFLFVLYLLMGAFFFYKIESSLEMERRAEETRERLEIQALLRKHYEKGLQRDVLDKLSVYCRRPLVFGNDVFEEEPFIWDFYNSVFFVLTVVSTIGYGNLAPSSAVGRIVMIFYALIGIPINGILLATLAEFFSTALVRVHRRYKSKESERRELTRTGLVADIVLYLVPGIAVFIVMPSALFIFFEGWTFDESLYYAFVTLTTIGFGDYVAGQTDKHRTEGGWFWVYKAFLLVWIVFGLGYLVMILGFITRALRSKRVARLEHRLATNLKNTQSRIWQSLAKDVGYLRRVLNELYVLRLSPVYKDEEPSSYQFRTRSSSEPVLYGLQLQHQQDAEKTPDLSVWRRRRANSECPTRPRPLPRVLSEGDLERIDRDATFRAAVIQPAELLAHVVQALGGPTTEEGVQGFSDDEILASEKPPPSPPPRGRASSEVRIPMPDERYNAEWTWSGDAASRRVHEISRARLKSLFIGKGDEDLEAAFGDGIGKTQETTVRSSISSRRRPSLFQMAAAKLKSPLVGRRRQKAKSIGTLFLGKLRRQSVPQPQPPSSEEDHEEEEEDEEEEQRKYFTQVPGVTTKTSMHSLLEETSLADLLRVMSSLHSRHFQTSAPAETPSVLDLFTPSSPQTPSSDRRSSLRTALDSPGRHRGSRVPLQSESSRRGSMYPAPQVSLAHRRFSVRPATTTSTLPAPPPPGPPSVLRLMRPELFQRQMSDPSARRFRTESEGEVLYRKPPIV